MATVCFFKKNQGSSRAAQARTGNRRTLLRTANSDIKEYNQGKEKRNVNQEVLSHKGIIHPPTEDIVVSADTARFELLKRDQSIIY